MQHLFTDPSLSASPSYTLPPARAGRKQWSQSHDPHPSRFYGDKLRSKDPRATRILFQNIKACPHPLAVKTIDIFSTVFNHLMLTLP